MIHAHRLFSVLPTIIFASVVFTIAATAQTPATKLTNTRDISIGLQAAITSMDPHHHNIGPHNSTLRHILEPLVKPDENQKLTPTC